MVDIPGQQSARRIAEGVGRFNEAAAPRLLSSRTVANAMGLWFIAQGALLMLAPHWAPTPLREVSDRRLDLGVGVALALAGVAAFILVNRPGATARQNWRIGGFLLCSMPFAAGLGLLLWPRQQDLLETHQASIGVVLLGMSLWGFVFAYAGGRVKAAIDGYPRLLASLLFLTGFGVGMGFLWEHPSLAGIAVMGLIVLLTTVLTANLLQKGAGFGLAGVRTAITLSIVTMFIGFVGFANDVPLTKGSVLHGTMENFWIVLSSVVGFHFGTQAWESVARIKHGAET